MITLTPQAAEQIRQSAAASLSESEALALRIAAKQKPDGSFDYGMGFDETHDEDITFKSEGVELVISPENGPHLKGTTIDYVELEPGKFHFIFMNPNDPNYRPPVGQV